MPYPPTPEPRLTLGLDIGSASIGWALVDPVGRAIVAAGVRVFDAGSDLRKFEQGAPGASNNTDRRAARLQRRQSRRRAGRAHELFLALQAAGLLPAFEPEDSGTRSERRHKLLDRLDHQLRANWASRAVVGAPAPDQTLPYLLRARALDEPLTAYELGRALYHLGQRRGFKSNRLEATGAKAERQKKQDEESQVKGAIQGLRAEMSAAGARTLGEFYSRRDPAQNRIRRNWTARDMFESEFDAIWQAQLPHHPELAGKLRRRLRRITFFQRPIAAGVPGSCELERGQRRARMASLPAQRFRLLQKVNDLELVLPDQSRRKLTQDERQALLETLEREGDLTFAQIKKRKIVAVPKGARFNLEAGNEKKIPGNRTAARLRAVFGPAWDELAETNRTDAVSLWLEPGIPEPVFRAKAQSRFGLTPEAADAWLTVSPEDGYSRLSRRALAKLLPLMEQGVPFKTAEADIYGTNFSGGKVYSYLPPVAKELPAITNPAVTRALTELRKLVNAIVREYGKPFEIRIELARDLKRNAEQRQRMSRQMRQRETTRIRAAERMAEETGITETKPSAADIAKILLYDQCKGECPYCGRKISCSQLFGDGAIDVDHILPRSRFPDDSFANKCLAHRACNDEKGNRTPREAFESDPGRWQDILARVASWKDPGKLKSFQLGPEDLDFSDENSFASRRLNETRYTTTQAARYLGFLYGGRDAPGPDGKNRQVIYATSGMSTAALRRAWGLEAILRQPEGSENGKNKGKPRHDHRHHAVDAVVVALTSNATIQSLSRAAAVGAAASGSERLSSRSLRCPWPNFVDSVAPLIRSINVSRRPSRSLQGSLHNDTLYSRPHLTEAGAFVHLRKPVHLLTLKNIQNDIVDPAVRAAVQAKLAAVKSPKNLERNLPVLHTRHGQEIPIRKCRIRSSKADAVKTIASGARERRVETSGNHHAEFFVTRDSKGREIWRHEVVTRLEAARRKASCRCPKGVRCDCIVRRSLADDAGAEFLFSLMRWDMVEMLHPADGTRELFVVRVISDEIDFVRHNLGAEKDEIKKIMPQASAQRVRGGLTSQGEWLRARRPDALRQAGCRKVEVDILGRVHDTQG